LCEREEDSMHDRQSVDGQAKVTIDSRQLKAYLEVTAPIGSGIPCSLEKAKQALAEKQVVFGLKEEKIKQAVSKNNWGKRILVAEGKQAKDGKDAQLIYRFKLPKERAGPKIDNQGNINYRDLGLVYNVKAGQILVEKIPPVEGVCGMDVRGQEIVPKKPRDLQLPKGRNTAVDEQGRYLYSSIDGHVSLIDNKVVVDEVFEVRGDVDFSTGDIDFVGSVNVQGNVTSGFKVKAAGDIEIRGYIEQAQVVAGGSIMVKGGITGVTKGTVKAGENIYARFVENSFLEAKNDIVIGEAIIQAHIRAGGSVRVNGKKAAIVGGVVQAGQEVESKVLGSPLATQTIVEVGVNPLYRQEYQKLSKERTEKKRLLDKINHDLKLFKKMNIPLENLTATKKEQLLRVLEDFQVLRKEMAEIEERLVFLENEFERAHSAKVKVLQTAYPGVRVSIGQAVYIVNDPIKYSAFVLDEGEVRLSPLR